ncbi:MAG: DeoR/GlpR family DNA-binding transcription regulator [Clostridiales bacterium]|jgi:DeoR/GlpR family transcriptional regulator of sugar metabolism|nr:DeoR/GlpR family DNA-binding transcription regulator [Clostridiales bacterium]
MLALERQNIILEKLREEKRVIVAELSRLFGVSEETVRRDLDKICQNGVAEKIYGGAVLNENANVELPFNLRKMRNVREKRRIAALAADMVSDGEHVMLDASTTAVFVARALKKKKDLTVVTNSLEVLIELADMTDWTVISSGGALAGGAPALLGPSALTSLAGYNADKLIFSCKGVHPDKGITDSSDAFSCVKQAMMAASRVKILAADSSKFDRTAFSRIADISAADIVVTDSPPGGAWLEVFQSRGVQCVYPEE